MEIPTPQPTTTTTTVKTPDPDSEPPQSNTVTNQLTPPPLTNGLLKRHNPLHHHPPPMVAYKECMKNHAAAMGGHAIDGCGEFMPSPTSLKCAACSCHRNFHRREPEDSLLPSPTIQHVIEYQPLHRHHPRPPPLSTGSPSNSPSSPPPISSSYYYPSAPHMVLSLSSGKKRFRTKFSQEQKDKMQELAEQVGWKMQKRDEDTITGFCNQIGVDKNVFKVWMHNNKSTPKNDISNTTDSCFNTGTGNVICPKPSSTSSSSKLFLS